MNKVKKVIIWVFTIIFAFLTVVAFAVAPPIEANSSDKILYSLSFCCLFGILLLGCLYELDIFHIQKKCPFFRIDTVAKELLLWSILFLYGCIAMVIVQSCMSEDYNERLQVYNESFEFEKQNLNNQERSTSEPEDNHEKDANMASREEQNVDSSEINQVTESFKNSGYSWLSLASDKDDYFKTIQYLSKNFRFEEYTEDINEVLSETGAQLVKDLYNEYKATGILNSEFEEAFTAFFSTDEYEDMFYSESENAKVFDMLSYSFEISWKIDGTYYIGLPEYDDEDIPEEFSDYLCAQGYANKGSTLYSIEDGQMVKAAEIFDIAYGSIIDNTAYGLALLVRYEGDNEQVWQDGDNMLSYGTYYVKRTDSGRHLKKDWDDYSEYFEWKQLGSFYVLPLSEVYMGAGSCKTWIFTILDYNKKLDIMQVQYPDSSVETKSYNAMVGNGSLYMME